MRRNILLLLIFISGSVFGRENRPFKVGVAGLTHDHVHWIMNRNKDADIQIVGIAEKNQELVKRFKNSYNLDDALFFNSLEEMLDKTKPEAVCAFNSISEHVEVVKAASPRGIHVMVEKPLAFSNEDANVIKKLSEKHSIMVLTNYETTWYPSNHEIFKLTRNDQTIGPIRKVVIHDGHKGPIEIGCSSEFTDWLTDPKYNGAGALVDFGCYGANIITWLMAGEKPTSVTAITQNIKPNIYSKVDDEATLILTYKETQCIIQASWNWPFNIKDTQVYGKSGYLFADNSTDLRMKTDPNKPEELMKLKGLSEMENDPFTQLKNVVRGGYRLPEFHPSSLENNLIVVEMLSEAIRQTSNK